MDFKSKDAIYLQIADYVNEHILLARWAINEKIPSVRELAAHLQVNPNTVMRTYEHLQQSGIIYNKRGIGFFVAEQARRHIKKQQRERFLERDLPEFFRNIYLLGINMDEITEKYQLYLNDNYADHENK
ncbi:GntR family transcriptional regulator [Parapedobacter indicus]|uniref:Transcriptional regulator, GntR family n=1 Tax=Parapedobacter indicus TaxID=1477437 RepID=A0A1I3IJE3_9SPHI|nr:GntR family transcriptional regulator [Parapedobacter indicus]PPL02192.1 GntR family transcriptional regulator [Parapedobacter indicus]SFI48020.1 transcriptional regulator, GntR family [Parapedobacter indicus]